MKKFYLLMALVLMAGVVHAQNNPNFGNRANLTQAKKAPSRVSGPREFTWTTNNQYFVDNLFTEVQNGQNIEQGQTMASTYENFVIRVSGLTSDSPYSVEFYDIVNGQEVLLHTFTYWKDDVHISPLRSLFTDAEINRIHRVKLRSSCNSGSLTFEEAYFISALPELNFKDKDGIDIGNAYIDPSYLIRSNRLWVDINPDRTFTINCAKGRALGTLSFSLPYKTGIDMSDVTFTATDFIRTADVMNRYIVENKRVDLVHKEGESDYTGAHRTVRELYNSRYSGAFYDQLNENALDGVGGTSDKAIKHVNNIYWQTYDFDTSGDTEEKRSVFCQDLCLTKNTIKARTTRKPLNPGDWTNRPEGFRNLDYPVRPYYRDENNWSDVVRGYWDANQKGIYTDLSRFDKMRISGSPNTVFNIRYATSLNGNEVTQWEPELHVKTDARGEANIDLDIYPAFYMQLIYFDGLYNVRQQIGNSDTDDTEMSEIRKTHYVNNVELFEGEGRLVDLVGSSEPNNTANMYHVWNNDNNYQWQYGTIVRWATTRDDGEEKFYQNYGTNQNENGLIWGTIGLYAENYADLTGYKAIRVYAESGTFRFIFNTIWNRSGQDNSRQVETATVDPAKGYAELDISNYEYFHLNGIKVNWGSSATVTAIKLVEDEEADYIFYGNGSYGEQGRAKIDPTVDAATKDETAKVIDTRARCNNMQVPYDGEIFDWVEHIHLPQTANPNVLFIERTNQFDSRKYSEHVNNEGKTVDDRKDFNLLVPSNDKDVHEFTSNNIELTDGFSFYAPKMIKAENATYTRTFTNEEAAVVNSIILPFPVDAGSATEKKSPGFYKAGVTLESTATEGRVGILEEQAVKKGDWLLQFSKYTGTTDANMPYLYVVAANTGKTDFTGVAAEGGKVIIPETPNVIEDGKYNMTNYEDALTLVNGEPKEGYYLRGVYEGTSLENILFYGANGTLYRTPRMTVTPFRTIIHSPIPVATTTWEKDQDRYFGVTTAGNVKVILADYGNDEAVGIDNVAVDGLFLEDAPIYNVAGQRVNSLDKGIYIVGGKKILVK